MCSNSQLEKHLECYINIFHQYSVHHQHWDMLSQGELKKMIVDQMPNFLKSQKDPKAIERIFADLDKNKDKQLSFEETMGLVVRVLSFCHDKIHEKDGQGQGHGHSHEHGHGH